MKKATVLRRNSRNVRVIRDEDFFLENIIILGQKVKNLEIISSDDLYFRQHHDLRTNNWFTFKNLKQNPFCYPENIACSTH